MKISIPALIDCHVHFREPGLTHKADMQSESASAIAGGVHTVCEMPNTVPPTVSIDALSEKVKIAGKIAGCDIRFFFGITESAHLEAFRDLWTNDKHQKLRERCCGVKLYLDHSTGDQKVDGGIVDDIFRACKELSIPLVAHCEDPEINVRSGESRLSATAGNNDVSLHSDMRPPDSEAKAITDAIHFVRHHGTALHIAHLSTSEGIDLVREAKKEGLPVTCEVAPHHLFLSTEDYGVLGTLGKMNPPLRHPGHSKALWEGIADRTVDCIATDHAPHTLEEKFVRPGMNSPANNLSAPSGVPGVETMLPLLLTVASGRWPHPRHERPDITFDYQDIVRLCFTNPNKIFRLGKSPVEDLITIDTEAEWTITAKKLHTKCGWTPYEGWRVKGKIVK